MKEDGSIIHFSAPIVLKVGEPITLHGVTKPHPKYGMQFEVSLAEMSSAINTRGLVNYLANNPEIKGIGPAKAEVLATKFGADFSNYLHTIPEQMAVEAHVSLDTIILLRETWNKSANINAAMTALAAYGLTHHQVSTLVDTFGNNAVNVMENNPYIIIGCIDGFAFKRVDKIALQMGAYKNKPERISAGIVFCVDEALDQGDTWVEYTDLVSRANLLLNLDDLNAKTIIEEYIDELIGQGAFYCHDAECRLLIAKPVMKAIETRLANIMKGAKRSAPAFLDNCRMREQIEGIKLPNKDGEQVALNDRQLDAVVAAACMSISLICGGAGSGKTFTLNVIAKFCDMHNATVVLCAPTGKAAKRMEESTGRYASTIHKLLGYDGVGYMRCANKPIDADVIIVDEVSMVDVVLADKLFDAIDLNRTSVVLVGDHNQLPPVGPGNLLRDLINTKAIPTTILTAIMRQSGVLKTNCNAILHGEVIRMPSSNDPSDVAWYVADRKQDALEIQANILRMFDVVLYDQLGYDIRTDVQLLTPTHKGPLGTVELNTKLQKLIQKKLYGVDVPESRFPRFYSGDKVIQTKNNYESGIMNGAMGIVGEVQSNGSMWVQFDDNEIFATVGTRAKQDIQLGYALTIHKSQGSEIPCSIVVMHKSHSFMAHRNLLYTGVTRARKTAIIVGDRWGISNCAKRVQVDARKTFLSLLLDKGEILCI